MKYTHAAYGLTTEPKLTPEQKLQKWAKLNESLKAIKAEESILRKEVIADMFPTHKVEGTENIELSEDWKLKATFKQTYEWEKCRDFSFDMLEQTAGVDLALLWESLSELPDSETILKSIFKVKVEFNATAYKKLLPTVQEFINPYIVVKEASTSLELVAPKEVK
jgi:hypothetical protein